MIADLVIHQLATRLEAVFSDAGHDVNVLRQSPWEQTEFALPAVSITAGREQRDHAWQELLGEQTDDGAITATWRTARVTLPLQLDLWATSKTDRHPLEAVLEGLFNSLNDDGLPMPHGVYLDVDGASWRVRRQGRTTRDATLARDGYCRLIWDLEASGSVTRQTEHTPSTFTITE